MKEVVQKGLNPGTEMAMVILMWFVASLLPFSSCQGAASPVITRFCLIRLYLTASQGHQGLGMGAFVRCSLQLIMINTHLLNTGVTQGQARGLFWLPLSHNTRVASRFKKESCIVLFTFLNTCIAATSPFSYFSLPF